MSIPGWKPTPKWIDDWITRRRWVQWLIIAIALTWFAAAIWLDR